MHEAAIAEGIVRTVRDALQGRGGEVRTIHLVAGLLTGLDSEALRQCLRTIGKGTRVESAELQISRPPAALRCIRCGREQPYAAEAPVNPYCDRCGGQTQLDGGMELYVESVELDE